MAGWTFGEASVRENFRNILLAFTKFLFSEGCQRIAKFNAKMLDFVRSSSRTSTIDSLFVEVFVCPASCVVKYSLIWFVRIWSCSRVLLVDNLSKLSRSSSNFSSTVKVYDEKAEHGNLLGASLSFSWYRESRLLPENQINFLSSTKNLFIVICLAFSDNRRYIHKYGKHLALVNKSFITNSNRLKAWFNHLKFSKKIIDSQEPLLRVRFVIASHLTFRKEKSFQCVSEVKVRY